MRSIIYIAMILTAAIASLWWWSAGHARFVVASSSQIFIHGTPVCVTQRGGEIYAAVGVCGNRSVDPQGDSERFHGSEGAPGNPHMGLPPGHPPIGDEPFRTPEEGRRVLI